MENVLKQLRRASAESFAFNFFRRLAFTLLWIITVTQITMAQGPTEDKLTSLIDEWYTTASKGDIDHFRELLTDDFQLIAFGDRFDKEQMLGMVKDYSNITYTLTNVRSAVDATIAFITFDIELKCNYQGKPIVGNATEVYILKKIDNQWKVDTKTILMRDDKK